ncbi:hypothetical protein GWA97_11385 [Flavobacterium sp. LaA7.5]|nr:hypothetical protein [Flavobacterium salilacus subsp. altitudinum]
MINSNFQSIFTIQVWHSYFSDGACKILQFIPATATRQLVKRYGFLNRKIDNGFEWYANTTASLPSYLNSIAKATGQNSFEFDIVTDSQLFYTYTDIAPNWKGQFLYSSKQTVTIAEKDTIQLTPTLQEGNTTILGKVTLYFDDIIALINNSKPAPYSIRYKARATQWQYYIINRNTKPENNLEIKGKTTITFNNPQDVTIKNGEKALLFTSSSPIALHEKPLYKFDLVSKSNIGTKPSVKVVYKGLPNPDPRNLDNLKDINQLASPMYVYI